MTADPLGDVFPYALELSRALGAEHIHVVLAVMGGPMSPSQRMAVAGLANLELRVSRYRLEWMEDPWAELDEAGHWLLSLAAETRPDLVHLNSYGHAALPFDCPTVIVAHSCILSWWRAVHGVPAPDEWQRYRSWVLDGLRSASALVAPSRAMAAALVQEYGEAAANCRIIYHGRAAEPFRASRAKREQVLAASRLWDEAENLAVLESAATRLTWPVRVAGASADPHARSRPARHLVLLGTLSEAQLLEELAAAAIFAAPARYEPFGLTILDAALSGCALVLGDIASLRELWDGAARFVSPADPDALTDALKRLAADRPARLALAAAARARAAQLSIDRMASGYLTLYRELRSSDPRRPIGGAALY